MSDPARRSVVDGDAHPRRRLLVGPVGDVEPSGKVGRDVRTFLARHGHPRTAEHARRVAAESRWLAVLVGADAAEAEAAAWLHDESADVPDAQRANLARRLGLAVLPEEDAHPMIVHQELSAVMARELCGIANARVSSAVGCHTTLKPGAGVLDKVLFVADKVEWDGHGPSPDRDELIRALDTSLDEAARRYLHALWARRESLKVIHPWAVSAHREFCDCPAFG